MTNNTIEELLLVATTETIQDDDSGKTSGMPKMSGNYKIFSILEISGLKLFLDYSLS